MQWWVEQSSEHEAFRERFHANVDRELKDLDSLFHTLRVSQRQSVSAAVQAGTVQYEAQKQADQISRLAAERKREQELLRLKQEEERELMKLLAAEEAAERDRQQRVAAAEKVRAAEEKLERTKRENAERAEREKAEQLHREKQETERAEKKSLEIAKLTKEKLAQEMAAKERAEKEQAEKQKFADEQLEKQEAEKRANGKAAAQLASHGLGTTRSTVDREFAQNEERIAWIKRNVRQAISKESRVVRNMLMNAKLELRPKFGMLTNSKSQLIRCRDAVKEVFVRCAATGNQLLMQQTFNVYAKLLIEQSESEAKVKLQNALPLAMLTVLLWNDFPEMGDFIIPRFIKKCPQLIGYYCNVSTEQGRKRMGWRRDKETGKYETEEQYMTRLAGICAVWAAMTQSKLGQSEKPHPYNLSHSWIFVARMLNKPAEYVTSVDYGITAAWWDMTAMRFQEAFGKQGTKMLDLASDAWTVTAAQKGDPPAQRLRVLGESWKQTGRIDHAWVPLKN